MRKAAGALVVVVLLAVALTWFVGLRAEAVYRSQLERLSALPAVRLIESRYQRGWLRSEFEVGFEVAGLLGERLRSTLGGGEDSVRDHLGVQVRSEVIHGLLPLARWIEGDFSEKWVLAIVHSNVSLDRETSLDLAPLAERLPSVAVETVVTRQRVFSRATAEPLRLRSDAYPFAFDLEALDAEVSFPIEGDRGRLEATLGRLAFSGGDRPLRLEGIELSADLRRHASGLDVGVDLDVERAQLGDGEPTPVALGLGLRRLDPASVRALPRLLRDQATPARLEELGLALLHASPEVAKLDLRVGEGAAELHARGRLAVDGSRVGDRLDRGLVAALEGKAKLSVPAPWFVDWLSRNTRVRLEDEGGHGSPDVQPVVVDAPDPIAPWLGAGLLAFDGTRYHASFELVQGALTWNERRFDLSNPRSATADPLETLPDVAARPLARLLQGR